MYSTRRQFLAAISAGAALAPLASSQAQTTLVWTDLATGIGRISGAGGNIYVLSGSDGVALIDGGRTERSEDVLKLVKDYTGKEPNMLFNTHCHRDQIGLNEILGGDGATFIAHENTRQWLGTEIISLWEGATYPPVPASALPTTTFYYDSEQLTFNNAVFEYGYLPQAHTDGDMYVYLPTQNLLFAGGVVAVGSYPELDYCTNGWIGGMIDSLNLLLNLTNDSTRIFASNGDEVKRTHLQAQLELCQAMAGKLSTAYYSGGSFAEFVASAPTTDFDAAWGDPTLFLHMAWEGVLPHVTEIRRYAPRV